MSNGFGGGRPSAKAIREQDAYLLRRQFEFRDAADFMAGIFAVVADVQRVALFGSVAKPLARHVPRFSDYRRHGIEVFHECKDLDLAVWLSSFDQVAELARVRNKMAGHFRPPLGGGVPNHQFDVFLLDATTNAYRGRLCYFGSCPKLGKSDCRVPGCGATPFLKQHEDFKFFADALDGSLTLFDRATGTVNRAAELPRQKIDMPRTKR